MMSFKALLLISVFVTTTITTHHAFAQNADEDSEIRGVEAELEKNIPVRVSPEFSATQRIGKKKDALDVSGSQDPEGNSQVVVIQKNYMPKTGRFNVAGGLTLFPSDVFFKTFGAQLRGGYHINEKWGAELGGILLTSSKSAELKDLEDKQSVTASNLATLKSYIGANIYFSNMYGKYAMSDRKIFPFEIYQTLGFGTVTTDKSSSPAFSAGLGQLFSLSRNEAVRIDLSLLFYTTETVTKDKQQATSLLITIAYDGLFPSVGKR